jgi:hypothetical protein
MTSPFGVNLRSVGRPRYSRHALALGGWQLSSLGPSALSLTVSSGPPATRLGVVTMDPSGGAEEATRQLVATAALADAARDPGADVLRTLTATDEARQPVEALYGTSGTRAAVVSLLSPRHTALGSLGSLPIYLYDSGLAARVDPEPSQHPGEPPDARWVRMVALAPGQRLLVSTVDLEAAGLELSWPPEVAADAADWLAGISVDVENRIVADFCLLSIQPQPAAE